MNLNGYSWSNIYVLVSTLLWLIFICSEFDVDALVPFVPRIFFNA